MRRPRKRALPVVLVVLGFYLLVGCFPIPTLRQSQPDGTPRPEHAIGPSKAVRIGQTHIDDAMIALSKQLQRRTAPGMVTFLAFGPGYRLDPHRSLEAWSVSPDRRRYSLEYSIRTALWVFPICFAVAPSTQPRWLTLDVDRDGVVIHATTTDHPVIAPTQPEQWLSILDQPTQRKFQAAGIMPTDETNSGGKAQPRGKSMLQRND